MNARYLWSALSHFLHGRIDFRTFRYALRERPIAVAGKGGYWIVDEAEYRRMHETE